MGEELRPGEVLEIGIVDPAVADLLVRQRVYLLQQQKAHHKARGHARTAGRAEAASDLFVDP